MIATLPTNLRLRNGSTTTTPRGRQAKASTARALGIANYCFSMASTPWLVGHRRSFVAGGPRLEIPWCVSEAGGWANSRNYPGSESDWMDLWSHP